MVREEQQLGSYRLSRISVSDSAAQVAGDKLRSTLVIAVVILCVLFNSGVLLKFLFQLPRATM